MLDNFQVYLKKQLLEYVENERKKGVPLEQIEKVLLDAGHEKNIIDEVLLELKKEEAGKKVEKSKSPVENDLIGQLKGAFSQFMAQSKEVKKTGEEIKKADSQEIVEEVIEEAEVIEEKTMIESATFFIYLVGLGLVILFTAGGTDSPIVNIAIGFAPVIINAFVSFFALSLADNVPLYVFIPLIITSIFYALGKYVGFFSNMDIEALAVVNFLLSILFNVMIVYARFVKPASMKKRVIKKQTEPKYEIQPVLPERTEIKELKKEFNIK